MDVRGLATASTALDQVERLREEWPKVRGLLGGGVAPGFQRPLSDVSLTFGEGLSTAKLESLISGRLVTLLLKGASIRSRLPSLP